MTPERSTAWSLLSRRISRRRFIAFAAAAGGATGLLAACQPAGPAAQPTPAAKTGPAQSTGGANQLKGTKLTVIAGDWYVPETNRMLDQLAADLGKETGMEVKIERFAGEQQVAKVAAVVESGSGADIALVRDFDAYLYASKLVDLDELAAEIEQAYGGFYDIVRQTCVVNGKWKALIIGHAPAAWNYRVDLFRAAGVERFPDTFDELLDAAKKLHAKGTPIGMTLGHASGDGRSTNYPVLWAFGGKEFEKDGRTVALDSPETLKAVEWYTEIYKYMIPGTEAWLDPDNNQAFLAGKVSATVNVNTIYLASRDAAAKGDAEKKALTENMDHANWPRGPAGRFAHYNVNLWVAFAHSPNRAGQLAFLRAWHDKKFLVPWTKAGQSYFIPPYVGLEKEDAWPDDPKLKIFRELNKLNRLAGWEGPPTPAVAEALQKFIIVDMFAKAATGQMKPAESVKWAANEYRQLAAKLG